MALSIHHRIRVLIEETNDAFSCCGNMNSDYAEFATLALYDFKNILSDPSLTSAQLKLLIRKSMSKCKGQDPESWASLMAKYVSRAANADVDRIESIIADLSQQE